MKFSIVTSFYNNNSGDYIKNIYDSVMNQTYDNFEWIITDDFSTDGTKEEILKLQNDKIKYINQKHKKEIFFNPQTYASGDVVVQLDSDDIIYPKALEVYNHYFNKHKDVLFMSCGTNYFNGDDFSDNHIIYHGDFKNCLEKKIAKDTNYVKYFLSEKKTNFLKINGGWGNLHAWRNIDVNFNEFNLDIFYMDKFRALILEEKGKYLHIPRTLYRNNFRLGSISHTENSEYPDDKKYYNLIRQRRNTEIESYVKIYDKVFNEIQPFLYSEFNLEKTKQNISLFSTSLTAEKQELLKELYFDHNLYFNVISDNIDYYFFAVDDKLFFDGDYTDEFIELCKQLNLTESLQNDYIQKIKNIIKNDRYKEVVIQHTPSDLTKLKAINLNKQFDGCYYNNYGFELVKIKNKE